MINIHVSRYPMRIVCGGHAYGAGEPGYNLVCCAVSTLMYTLIAAANEIDINNTSTEEEGFMDVIFTPRPARAYEADMIFKTILSGLDSLAKQYPEYISIRKEYD